MPGAGFDSWPGLGSCGSLLIDAPPLNRPELASDLPRRVRALSFVGIEQPQAQALDAPQQGSSLALTEKAAGALGALLERAGAPALRTRAPGERLVEHETEGATIRRRVLAAKRSRRCGRKEAQAMRFRRHGLGRRTEREGHPVARQQNDLRRGLRELDVLGEERPGEQPLLLALSEHPGQRPEGLQYLFRAPASA